MNQRTRRVLEYDKIVSMLVELCHSPLGGELAEKLAPSYYLHEIKGRLKETGEAETMLLQKGSFMLEGLQDVTALLKKADVGSVLDPGQLLSIKRQLTLARKARSHYTSFEERGHMDIIGPAVQQIMSLKTLEDRIETCIISDSEVSDNASVLLRQLRRQIQQKNDAVKSKLNQMIQSVKTQKYLQDALVTIRQGRYVIPVKQEYKSMVPGLVHDQSSSGATLFIEPMAIVELNNQLKELKLKEELEIDRILMELTGEVTDCSDVIRTNQDMMQLLDFYMAKGRLSVQMKGVEPELADDQSMRLKNARHPLIPASDVVPITLELGNRYKALIVTGPNTGGKTVTLKTAGLLVLMAQSGLHIPADYGSKIGVFDHVFADIGDEQSIEQSLSTFSSHMTNIVGILRDFTDQSLILLDELGAGTDPDEGAALAMAILEFLITRSSTVIATTHYSELKQFALLHEQIENACVEFDVETLSPTYKLLIGIPGKSNAFEISKKLGMDEAIIDEARLFLTKENVAFEDVLQTIEGNRKKMDEALEEAARIRREAQQEAKEVHQKQQKLQSQKERILSEAKMEAQQLIKKTKVEMDDMMQELKQLQKDYQNREVNRETEKLKQRLRKQMDEVGHPGDDLPLFAGASEDGREQSLKNGDDVKITSLGQTGNIISMDEQAKTALVQVGVMKMTLPLSHLEKDVRQKKQVQKGLQKMIQIKTETSKSEVDVRGTDLEEALFLVDKYLDDAYLSGREQITIIHGVGSGILKRGIQGMLKKHRHVSRFRDGSYGEGGAGVTMVTFKKN